jgi:hypothetical protein
MDSLIDSLNNLTIETFDIYLKKRTDEFLELNKKEFIENINKREPKVLSKIKNFYENKWISSERLETSFEEYLELIKKDKFLQMHFRKDPTKQSIHEKVQIEWIKKFYPDVVKLPTDTNGLYFQNGQLKKIDSKRNNSCSKTIDIEIPSKKIYGILKYSTTAGGAQDNQKDDVVFFIREIVKYLDKFETDYIFHIYLDGAYYTQNVLDLLKSDIPEEYFTKIIMCNCKNLK